MLTRLMVAFCAAFVCVSAFAPTNAQRNFLTTDMPAVVFLFMPNGGACTGSVISADLILTAAHCVEGVGTAMAELAPNQWEQFDVVYEGISGSRWDVALLRGNTHGIEPLPLADASPALPYSCFMWGFAGEPEEALLPCEIKEDLWIYGYGGFGEVRSGDSGGPVVSQGKLVGVIWGGLRDNASYVLIAPVEAVHAALAAIGELD